jgi:hypothetical protein
VAVMAVHAQRRVSTTDRLRMVGRCGEIEGEIINARTDILLHLVDAPRKVTSNTKVTDAERALDNLLGSVVNVRRLLTSADSAP